jgi:hypothetical protein
MSESEDVHLFVILVSEAVIINRGYAFESVHIPCVINWAGYYFHNHHTL